VVGQSCDCSVTGLVRQNRAWNFTQVSQEHFPDRVVFPGLFVTHSNVRIAIQFWAVLILFGLCAIIRAGRDGFAALVAPIAFGTII